MPNLSDMMAWLLFILIIVWNILISLLFKRLKAHHPQKFKQLARPNIWRRYPRHNFLTIDFIWSREYELLYDKELNRLCRLIKKFMIATLITLIIVFILIW